MSKDFSQFTKAELLSPAIAFADAMHGHPDTPLSENQFKLAQDIQKALLDLRQMHNASAFQRRVAVQAMRTLHHFVTDRVQAAGNPDMVNRVGRAMGIHERSIAREHSLGELRHGVALKPAITF